MLVFGCMLVCWFSFALMVCLGTWLMGLLYNSVVYFCCFRYGLLFCDFDCLGGLCVSCWVVIACLMFVAYLAYVCVWV